MTIDLEREYLSEYDTPSSPEYAELVIDVTTAVSAYFDETCSRVIGSNENGRIVT